MMNSADRYRIKVLDKALAVLGLFDERRQDLTVKEVTAELGIKKTTAFRILTALGKAGLLETANGSGRYRLGYRLSWLGSLVGGHRLLQEAARPFLEGLQRACGETVHLVVLCNGEALYIDKIEGHQAVHAVTRVGMTLPAHCSGVGKALLAHVDERQVDEIIAAKGLPRFTENTIVDSGILKREFQSIRARGYAIDFEEIERGLKCVAAPIRGAGDGVVAAVSVSGPNYRFGASELPRLGALVVHCAEQISSAISVAAPTQPKGRPIHVALADASTALAAQAG